MDTSFSSPGIGWSAAAAATHSIPAQSTVVAGIGAFLRPDSYEYQHVPLPSARSTASSALSDPRANHILAALPDADFTRWNAQLEPCDMPLGKILFEAGCQCTHAYFPTTSIISMLYLTAKGEAVETAVAGCDGIGGLPLLTTGSLAPGRAIVRSGGHGFRLNASWVMQEFDRSRAVQQLLLRYMQAVLTQTSQIAVCNRLHSLEQQLSRWLLMSLDRVSADEILATQELIASSLGVRREGVTAAAGHLQDAGLISYRRGHISVLNREGLERSACECYAVLKQDYEALMPETALAT